MDWFYALNDVQSGPISTEELGRLLQNETITAHTMVWREGMADWQPCHTVAPMPPPVVPPAPAAVPVRPVIARHAPITARAVAARPQPVAASAEPAAWRRGSQLFMKRTARLPKRCICCDEAVILTNPDGGKALTFPLTWRHPLAEVLRLLLFAATLWMAFKFNNPGWPSQRSYEGFFDRWWDITLCLIIIGAVDRKLLSTRANITLCVCPLHARRRITRFVVAWAVFACGFALLFSVRVLGPKAVFGTLASFILMPVGLLLIRFAPLVRLSWIDSQFMQLKGVSPAFLDHLPEYPDEQAKA